MSPVRRLLLFLLLCSMHGHAAGAPARSRRAVNVQEARISVSYRLALEKALGKLRIWLASNPYPPINELEKDVAQFNSALVGHLQWLYEGKQGWPPAATAYWQSCMSSGTSSRPLPVPGIKFALGRLWSPSR